MDTHSDIKKQILEKIQNGELKMRPKAFFAAKIALVLFVAFVILIAAVFLMSYTLFSLNSGGNLFLLGFGGRGFFQFFLVFPWIMLLIIVGLLLILDWLLKEFKFAYHNPVLYVFVGSVLVVCALGVVVSMTSLHKNLEGMAENKHLPIPGVSGFYVEMRRSRGDEGLFRGEVTEISTSSFMIRQEDGRGGVVRVFTPRGFEVSVVVMDGDMVFVAGDMLPSGEIKAYGIKKLSQMK